MKKLFFLLFCVMSLTVSAQVRPDNINGIRIKMPLNEFNDQFKLQTKPEWKPADEDSWGSLSNPLSITIKGIEYEIVFVHFKNGADKAAIYSIATSDGKSKGKNPVGVGSTLTELQNYYANDTTDYNETDEVFSVSEVDRPTEEGEYILYFSLTNGKVTEILASVYAAG